jgi:hypothetical protein
MRVHQNTTNRLSSAACPWRNMSRARFPKSACALQAGGGAILRYWQPSGTHAIVDPCDFEKGRRDFLSMRQIFYFIYAEIVAPQAQNQVRLNFSSFESRIVLPLVRRSALFYGRTTPRSEPTSGPPSAARTCHRIDLRFLFPADRLQSVPGHLSHRGKGPQMPASA